MQSAEKMEIHIKDYYIRYGPMVLRRCRQLLKDEEKAMDAMQEVFTKLLLHKERLKNLYPSSLLFRISTNLCLNIMRAQHIHQSIDDANTLTKIALYDESEDRLMINDILERIFKKEKKSTRAIAVMHFVDGMTLKEVAAEVGLSLSGVRKRIKRLRERIKQTKEI
jgi:RNA polymerase sigma-70 factor (ECF subfamily)